MSDSVSVEAITLARAAFSSAQGQLGLIKFSIEELVPADGSKDSRIWNLSCSFYESLGSSAPTRYSAVVNLDSKTVSIKKIDSEEAERKFTVVEEGGDIKTNADVPPPGGVPISAQTSDPQ